jgi:acyl carrier protein
MNSKLYSFPPIVQYYDVVGTVTVNSLSKLQEYKREVENEIYKWLDNNCSFGTKIYKSDIVKFFNNRPETSYVDLDIRVSDIIKAQDVKYIYSLQTTSLDNIFYYNVNNNPARQGYILNKLNYNCIKLPLVDSSGATLKADNLRNKTITLEIVTQGQVVYNENIYTNKDVYSTESFININFDGNKTIDNDLKLDSTSILRLVVSIAEDFYSTSTFTVSNANDYGLSTFKTSNLARDVANWVNNATPTYEANRAIPLPYFVKSMGKITREETITRKGTLQTSYETQLTEKAFWMYLIPYIIKTYYGDIDLSDEDINGKAWQNIANLIYSLYTQFKATFADSILDDNNNIVNFSMDNELPVVRLKITYKYGV